MNALHHSPLGVSTNPTFMETIMQPLSFARRSARWLMAAGLALAAMQAPALAQPTDEAGVGDPGPTVHPEPGEAPPFFEKIGEQVNCDYVRYRLRFGAKGDPAKFLDPEFIAEMQDVRIDIRDTLPAGLEIVDVGISGDGTDATGLLKPIATVSTTTNPNDTVKLEDIRLSTSDLDGSGEIDRRYIDVFITAKIDHAAFPAPAVVANQAFATITRVEGIVVEVPSHDPALPDDGDISTGEPTEISIDVTRCEPPPPPPPPGDEACFEVDRGEVDCVPGGGAFIYHMPVGPELGGKWVQLRTTTPGVIVAPLSQLAPIGGGVLNWTITGALPGDVVHLIVSGIETYAGPEEGVGLCCSQVIDIVIPEDIECPPDEGEPDIKVEKRADDARCTPEGPCDFTIRVTNVGDEPYNGPIVLEEVTGPGAAPVVSGPNAPWACPPMVSPMVCTHPATTLDPGEWVELKLGFAPGPGWNSDAIRNCAEYDYTASGFPDVFGSTADDKACASIPICRRGDPRCDPPVEKKADLRITKDPRSLVCSPDGVCTFNIRVFNNGTDNYVGPLTVVDEYPTGVPASSTFAPIPPWACGPIGGGQFQCDHPGVALVPGAFVSLSVRAVVGEDYGDLIRNCAEVKAIADETDLTNNRDCAEMRVPGRDPGQPALRILKTCEQDTAPGAAVSCRITVVNAGNAAPNGPVRVNDAAEVIGSGAPVQILTVTPDGAEWACGPVPANALACQIPGALMTSGTSRHFDVTVQAPTHARFENCARGNWGPAPGNDIVYPFGEACAEGGNVPPPINVEKTGDKDCRVGEPCTFEITITNGGTAPFSGPVRIGDAIGVDGTRLEGVEITEISPPFGCSPEPAALPMSCVATLTLGPGESRVHQVTVVIPEGGPLANIREPLSAENCVGVVPPDTPVAAAERMMSTAPQTTGQPGTQPYACHAFTIADQVRECSPGFVMNDAGRCVCPEGTTFRNGQCRPVGGEPPPLPPPPPPPPVEECRLLPGQIRTESGRCVCPRGTELRNGRCVKDEPPVVECRLLPGQIRLKDGRCACPRGTSLVRGECRKDPPPQCKLLPGQIRTQDGRCVCPRGTSLVRGQCRKDAPPQCKLLPGQIRTQDGRCVCPRGTSLVRGKCVERVRECPRGTVLRNGRCVVVEPERCPRGTVGTPPNCRKLRISPDLQRLIDPTQKQRQQVQ
ncbi:EB domain-containing protein [Mesorhizobium sp. YM1C-6-2]|uniref:EB domain-containing protein n=1 Tax=Mesorhizobium sp. YM1C-6-2 TaxID=1827501 RepID=UPI000EF188A2|nr:EB domain-containing protein [Mesorhizobium sp. YM1C-6-2]RLP27809.1 hypothetical protein D8676_01195 [Mesorhizobium sp. YM1C-6-2]